MVRVLGFLLVYLPEDGGDFDEFALEERADGIVGNEIIVESRVVRKKRIARSIRERNGKVTLLEGGGICDSS